MSSEADDLRKRALIQVASGGGAGLLEVLMMHPLDLVKTRLQLQKGPAIPNDPEYYTGIIDCFSKLYKQEGILALWKGLVPPLIVETPTKSVRFASYHYYKTIFSPGREPNIPRSMLTGYCAGFTESFVICPFEVVKVSQQANRAVANVAPSAWAMASSIIKEGGLFGRRGIYRGLGATIYRHSIFNCVYLGIFYPVKRSIPLTGNWLRDNLVTLAIAVSTGSLASVANIPFDVAKSRIQAPQPKGIKYKNTLQSVALVAREEGVPALYKGLVAKIMRLGPGGAILIIFFDLIQNYLNKVFP